MAVPRHIHLRSARDRLFDLLGHFGKTAPLRDIPVVQDKLTVPHGGRASVAVDPGQLEVRYMLRHRDGSTVGAEAGHATGNGGRTAFATPPITEDVTYKVLARKTLTEREAYLHALAPVRVGLDTTLPARIVADPLVPPPSPPPADADPRIVDYGSPVTVQIDSSQEGVDYELVVGAGAAGEWEAISTPRVTGTRSQIALVSRPMHEDAVVRVRAVREFDPSERLDPQVDILDAVMPLAVRADPARAVTTSDDIVDHAGSVTITVADAQPTATYAVYGRRLSYADFVYGDDPTSAMTVEVPGEPAVRVRRPPTGTGLPTEPFAVLATADPGSGDLTLDVANIVDDHVLVVVATKDHGGVPSHVTLDEAVAVLARPDPAPALSFAGTIQSGRLVGGLRVSGGQRGVLYYFRPGADAAELPLPAYFPEPQEIEEGPERGIGELRVGVDFVVAHDPAEGDPVIELPPGLELPVELYLRALKARTRLATAVEPTLLVPARPAVRLDTSDVTTGATARITIGSSIPGEAYQAFVDDEPLGAPLAGNDDDLAVDTGALAGDAAVAVEAISPPTHPGYPILRRYELFVTVWPPVDAHVDAPLLDPGATGPASPRVVDYGASAAVVVANGQPGVDYVAVDVAGEEPAELSKPVAGVAGTLVLTVPSLAEDALLAVQTARTIDLGGEERRSLVHEPFLPVAVRANRTPGMALESTVVAPGQTAAVEIATGQASTSYTVHGRPLADTELFPSAADATVIVDVGGRELIIRSPWPADGEAGVPDGFMAVAAPAAGADGALTLPVAAREDDALLVVTATKEHAGGATTVVLRPLLAVFVTPDPAPNLRLAAQLTGGKLTEVELTGGQPGVMYHLRARGARRDATDLPAFFHRPDPGEPEHHRGLEQLRLGHDFVLARGAEEGRALDPSVPTYRALDLPVEFAVRAVKIGTETEIKLDHTAVVAGVPDIGLDPGQVDPGSSATIVVRASAPGETYQAHRDGESLGPAQEGDGGDLTFDTGPIEGDTVFVVVVSGIDQEGIPVERRVTLPVRMG